MELKQPLSKDLLFARAHDELITAQIANNATLETILVRLSFAKRNVSMSLHHVRIRCAMVVLQSVLILHIAA